MDTLKTRPGFRPARLTPGMIAAVQNLSEPRWAEGEYIIFLRSHDKRGVLQWVPLDGGAQLNLTSDPPPSSAAAYAGGLYDVSEDHVVYTTASGALAVMPLAGGPGRMLPAIAGTQAQAPAFSPGGGRIAFVSDNGQTSDVGFIGTREAEWPQLLATPADFVIDPTWHPDEEHLAWVEWDVPNMGWDESRIVICNRTTRVRRIVMGEPQVSATQPRWSPDGRRLAFLCDRGGWLNLWLADADGSNPRPLVEDEAEHGTAPWNSGAHTYSWSPDSASIVYARTTGGAWGLHIVDVATGATRDLKAPPGVYSSVHWSPDGHFILAGFSGPATAPQVRVCDLRNGAWRVLATGAVGGIEDGAVSPQAITWPAPDGLPIPGLLYMPALTVGERAPLLVWVHGGPTGQSSVAFNP
ncbi:MAG TPA: hypothetical protein VM536_10425, partial [Chloroflexia bacterium]|nr:hypothetical protein [Chloroflexia bacterium]